VPAKRAAFLLVFENLEGRKEGRAMRREEEKV